MVLILFLKTLYWYIAEEKLGVDFYLEDHACRVKPRIVL
jgi:hypothetical protein